MEIRKFTDKDAVSISVLIEECFNTMDLGGHTEEGKRMQFESNGPEKLRCNGYGAVVSDLKLVKYLLYGSRLVIFFNL